MHDPSCRKLGDYYYMYSTDAIYRENKKEAEKKGVPLGYIQVRRSKDLVNWEFCGSGVSEDSAGGDGVGALSCRRARGDEYLGSIHHSIRKEVPPLLLCIGFRTQDILHRTGRITLLPKGHGHKRAAW